MDQWVLSMAMFIKTFWLTQSLDTQVDYDLESFKEALSDLKHIRKPHLILNLVYSIPKWLSSCYLSERMYGYRIRLWAESLLTSIRIRLLEQRCQVQCSSKHIVLHERVFVLTDGRWQLFIHQTLQSVQGTQSYQ